ncbi:MAG: ribonuclease R [Candidatus Brocadiales bacterium]
MTTSTDLTKFLRSKRYRPMNARELAEHFDIQDNEYREFRNFLRLLELQGEIVQIKDKQYALPSKVKLLVGTLDCNPRGFGFVVPIGAPKQRLGRGVSPDIYVNEKGLSTAMHGDIVVVRLPETVRDRRGKRGRRGTLQRSPTGQIVNVLQRANETLVGVFEKTRKFSYVVPDNSRLFKDVYVSGDDSGGANPGDKVIVKVVQWPSRHLNPEGVVTEVLGPDGAPGVDSLSVVYQFNLSYRFSAEVLHEAEEMFPPVILEQEYQHRVDLRNKMIITIDPKDAKDFDDAISLEKIDGNTWLLGVHIADVSHYVHPDSVIDTEARKRGTSVYFPGEVIPMLPEQLSNGICSLRKGEDRLTKSVFMTFDSNGTLVKYEIKHSVINVKERLNYDQATRILEGDEDAEKNVKEILNDAAELANLLFENRLKRGALELDLPEVSVHVDSDGMVTSVEKFEKHISHRVVEEFMLSANEAVARFLQEHKIPGMFRVHPLPDEQDVLDFAMYIKGIEGVQIDPFNTKQIQKLLEDVRGEPEAYVVNLLLLKSLKQATYSATQTPHFALALEHYSHFTSPIRRYPDLIVHRLLDQYFSKELVSDSVMSYWESNLPVWASHCSITERRAEDAEREIIKLKLLRFLENRIGDEMDAVITGVQEYGLFVQLNEYLVEGLIHIRTLTDDFYEVSKLRLALIGARRGKVLKVGDCIKVRIDKIDMLKREVDFVMAN